MSDSGINVLDALRECHEAAQSQEFKDRFVPPVGQHDVVIGELKAGKNKKQQTYLQLPLTMASGENEGRAYSDFFNQTKAQDNARLCRLGVLLSGDESIFTERLVNDAGALVIANVGKIVRITATAWGSDPTNRNIAYNELVG